ncbi:MAG TPA: hypothetical protein VLC46_20250 [Thermoanaerobaculia bacterium]|jgi:hypothetical protein|nr:hypothetical protein [Thermoanaerobaculia bacterium]
MSSAYGITPQDLQQRLELAQLLKITLDAPPYTEPDWSLVDEKISEAEADFHMAASSYYATPITARDDATSAEATELITFVIGKILDLAMYKLLQRRPNLLNAGDKAIYYSGVKKSLDAWLALIRGDDKTRQTLGVARERTTQISSSAGAFSESEPQRVTRRGMGGFI